MRTRKTCLALLLAALAWPGYAQGQREMDPEPIPELLRLSKAIEKAKIEARFEAEQMVYAFSEDETVVSRFRVQYAYPFRRRECLEGPGESRVVLLEDGTYQWSYFPARKLVIKEPLRDEDSPFPLCPPEDLPSLTANYRIQILGPVPAEGMHCRIVSFVPRWGDRPRREWWLEERWNVPVRVRVHSGDGKPAYMKQLREIRWNPDLTPETFRLRVPRDTRIYEIREHANLTLEEVRRLLQRPFVVPHRVPVGYKPLDFVLREEGGRRCLQIMYTDGLSSFSFFQAWSEPEEKGPAERNAFPVDGAFSTPSIRRQGFMNVVALPPTAPGQRALLVGDLQYERLIEMAESIRHALGESLGRSHENSARPAASPP